MMFVWALRTAIAAKCAQSLVPRSAELALVFRLLSALIEFVMLSPVPVARVAVESALAPPVASTPLAVVPCHRVK